MKKKFIHKQPPMYKQCTISKRAKSSLNKSNIHIQIPMVSSGRITNHSKIPQRTIFIKDKTLLCVNKNYNYGLCVYIHKYIPVYKNIPLQSVIKHRQIVNVHYDIPQMYINVFVGDQYIEELSLPYNKELTEEQIFQYSTIYNMDEVLHGISIVKKLLPKYLNNTLSIKSILGAML